MSPHRRGKCLAMTRYFCHPGRSAAQSRSLVIPAEAQRRAGTGRSLHTSSRRAQRIRDTIVPIHPCPGSALRSDRDEPIFKQPVPALRCASAGMTRARFRPPAIRVEPPNPNESWALRVSRPNRPSMPKNARTLSPSRRRGRAQGLASLSRRERLQEGFELKQRASAVARQKGRTAGNCRRSGDRDRKSRPASRGRVGKALNSVAGASVRAQVPTARGNTSARSVLSSSKRYSLSHPGEGPDAPPALPDPPHGPCVRGFSHA